MMLEQNFVGRFLIVCVSHGQFTNLTWLPGSCAVRVEVLCPGAACRVTLAPL